VADELEIRHLDGVRAVPGDRPRLVGYAIRTNVLSEDLGGFREVITPEAVRHALEASGDIVALRNHNPDHVLGRLSAKTLRLEADDQGLRFEVDVPEAERGLVESVARGDLTGASFGFYAAVDEWDLRTTPPTRTIRAMKIREISAGAVWPAYPQTHVAALRSLERAQKESTAVPDTITSPATVTVTEPVPPVPPAVSPEARGVEVVGEERILRPGDSFRGFLETRGFIKHPEYAALTPGHFMRAMLTGPRSDLERRALGEASDATGGVTVPDITAAVWVERLRAALVVGRAGASTVPLTSDRTTIARQVNDPVPAWRQENAAVAESDPSFDGIVLTPRSLAVFFKVSRELLQDSINIEAMLTNALTAAMAREVDRVALRGSGTAPEPRGIANTTGVNTHSMGTNGGQLTDYGPLIEAWRLMAEDNAAEPGAFVMAPRTWATIEKLKDTTGQPLQRPPALQGKPFLVTTALPINETHGTATNASRIITGDWSELLIGMRAELRIEVLRELFAGNLQFGFLAHMRLDIALAHPESFAMVTGIIP
jgi:HK97 family phage major capsid protein/HK97 family phage prohead protease